MVFWHVAFVPVSGMMKCLGNSDPLPGCVQLSCLGDRFYDSWFYVFLSVVKSEEYHSPKKETTNHLRTLIFVYLKFSNPILFNGILLFARRN